MVPKTNPNLIMWQSPLLPAPPLNTSGLRMQKWVIKNPSRWNRPRTRNAIDLTSEYTGHYFSRIFPQDSCTCSNDVRLTQISILSSNFLQHWFRTSMTFFLVMLVAIHYYISWLTSIHFLHFGYSPFNTWLSTEMQWQTNLRKSRSNYIVVRHLQEKKETIATCQCQTKLSVKKQTVLFLRIAPKRQHRPS